VEEIINRVRTVEPCESIMSCNEIIILPFSCCQWDLPLKWTLASFIPSPREEEEEEEKVS